MQLSFLLTRPSRGATNHLLGASADYFISTHTPLAGRDLKDSGFDAVIDISTHTPLAGRDIGMIG